jgi:hypothetical protein
VKEREDSSVAGCAGVGGSIRVGVIPGATIRVLSSALVVATEATGGSDVATCDLSI